jgi:Tfp pilus assembly protein PilN
MSRSFVDDELIIGGEPRADLLPPEVKAGLRGKALQRGLLIAVLAVVLLVAGGVGVATWQAMQGQSTLLAAQSRTAELLTEQGKYLQVRQVQDAVKTTIAAQQVGGSTEIDWKDYLQRVRALLPDDVAIDSVTIDAATPLAPYGPATAPLQDARVATLVLLVTSPALPEVPDWLRGLRGLPGFADATPSAITRTESGAYQVSVTLHINDEAYSGRFAEPAGGQ